MCGRYQLINDFINLPDLLNGDERSTYLQKAKHAIIGFEYDFNENWSINIEAYLKDFNQLINLNRNKLYEDDINNSSIQDELKKDIGSNITLEDIHKGKYKDKISRYHGEYSY